MRNPDNRTAEVELVFEIDPGMTMNDSVANAIDPEMTKIVTQKGMDHTGNAVVETEVCQAEGVRPPIRRSRRGGLEGTAIKLLIYGLIALFVLAWVTSLFRRFP